MAYEISRHIKRYDKPQKERNNNKSICGVIGYDTDKAESTERTYTYYSQPLMAW